MSNKLDLSQFELAYQYLSEGILLFDNEGRVRYANPAFVSEFQIAVEKVYGRSFTELFLLNRFSESGERLLESLNEDGHWSGVLDSLGQDKKPLSHFVQIDSIKDNSSNVLCHVARFSQPNTSKEGQAALQEMAYRDELTGLANRALFKQLLKHEISQSQRQDGRFAVLFIDLDGFKQVNDNVGHDAGDVLLCTIAERLEKSLRKSDVVARLGGDEFVVIMNNIKDSETIAKVAEKIIRQIRKPVSSGANIVEVGCSIGISIYPDNGLDADNIVHHADAAMYRAKQQGGANYFYFSDELNRELQDSRKMERDIISALADRQFVPYFQPLIDQRNGKIVGIECLARWNHPEQGLKTPIEFIPAAKKVGLLHEVLGQVLEQAFSYLGKWHRQLGCLVPLSVNVTSRQFYQQQTFDKLTELLEVNQLSTDAIRIEVTESTLQEKGEALLEQLRKISHAGFSITLDDFGTGYSSLRYLQRLPVDSLKIDRSFVRNIDNNPHDKIIVKAIIQLAQTLGIEAVAEGVETQAQKRFLIENQCQIMQGYLFSPALPAAQFDQYLEQFLEPIELDQA